MGLNPLKDLKPRQLVGVFLLPIFVCEQFFVYLLYMKKYTLVLAAFVATTLVACGSGSTATQSTDSAAVENVTDTTHQKDTTDYKNENAARLAELKDSTAK